MFRSLTLTRLNSLALFVVLLVSYAYVFPRWADPNQDSRLKMIVAVVDDGTFQIDKYLGTTVDYARVGDHYYSDKAPGAAFLGMPVYAALRVVFNLPIMDQVVERLSKSESFQATLNSSGSGVLKDKVRFALAQIAVALVVGAIPSALLGVLLYWVLGQFNVSLGWRVALVLAYGWLTPAFAYANSIYGHQLCAALLFGAFYLLFTLNTSPSVWRLLFIGLLLGYSVITEYPAALMVGVLWLYALYRLWQMGQARGIVWVSLTGGLMAALWMTYNTAIFGGPLNLGYSYSEQWVTQHHTGFMSLSLPTVDAIWGMTFSAFRGLFVFSPWLLLSVPGFWLWWQSKRYRAEWVVALAGTLAFFAFNASSAMWWGGFAVGPRYLLPALPLMILPLAFVIKRWDGRAFRIVSGILAMWSLITVWGMTLAGQAFPPDAPQALRDNPWLTYALPNWQNANLARNLGTIVGLRGYASLIALVVMLAGLGVGWWWLTRRAKVES